jgi:hypothetical protein
MIPGVVELLRMFGVNAAFSRCSRWGSPEWCSSFPGFFGGSKTKSLSKGRVKEKCR